MAQPIYKIFLGKATEAWYQLSEAEQSSLFAQVGAVLEQAGGKSVIVCNSTWASEQWQFFGVEEFPNLEAIQKQAAALDALHWFRYVDAITTLGTEWGTAQP